MNDVNIYDPRKKRTFTDFPQYFGSYLNQARHNVFTINNHIAEKLGFKTLNDDAQIPNSFLFDGNNNKLKQHELTVFAILKRYLPISKVFDTELLPAMERKELEKTEKEKQENNQNYQPTPSKNLPLLRTQLKKVFRELNEFRNDYTHYYSLAIGNDRKVKISDGLKDFLITNYKRAIAYTKQRFADVFNEEDFKIAENVVLVKGNNLITQDGIVFFTCMFLDRENSVYLMSNAMYFKGTHERTFIAKREVMMAYCVMLPHDKYTSDNPAQALSLDLINELNKCPKLLYNVVSEDAKKQFQPDVKNIENVLKNSVNEDVEDYDSYIKDISKKVRNENRFYYFALRYLDLNRSFASIRFHIDLGKLLLQQYDKDFSTGLTNERRISENAKAFARLDEVMDMEKVLNHINKNNTNTEFEQFAPHYNMDKNKIGISLSKNDEFPFVVDIPSKNEKEKNKINLNQPKVDAFISVHCLQQIIVLEHLEKGKAGKLIEDFIAFNNDKLFNRTFIDDIKNKLNYTTTFNKRAEGKVVQGQKSNPYNEDNLNELNSRKQKLTALLSPYGYNAAQIPERIIQYWLNIEDVNTKHSHKERIRAIRKDCKQRLKDIEIGKPPKIGEMATFLAKDIVNMIIGKDKKEKITSFYYDKMQECFALFEDAERKELLLAILNIDLGLCNKNIHPFLDDVNLQDIRYTKDVYKSYLENKFQYIEKTFYKKVNNKTDISISGKQNIPYSIQKLIEPESNFEEWLRNTTKGKTQKDRKKSIDLPVNLFDNAIRENLIKQLEEKEKSLITVQALNKLFKFWWKEVKEDDVQKWYHSERSYSVMAGNENRNLNFLWGTKPRFSDYVSDDFVNEVLHNKNVERAKERKAKKLNTFKLPDLKFNEVKKSISHRISETEKEIRLIQEQDRAMVLMFESLAGQELNTKLKIIDNALSDDIEAKQEIKGKLSFDDEGNFTKTGNEIEIVKTITEKRKRKEFSVLRKYSFDKRIPELMDYFQENEIPASAIRNEIRSYVKHRDFVFDDVFDLEKAMLSKVNPNELKTDKDQKEHLQHHQYLDWLLENNYIDNVDYQFLKMVRNAFSHNQFPRKVVIEKTLQLKESDFAQQIYEVYHQKMADLIEKFKPQNDIEKKNN